MSEQEDQEEQYFNTCVAVMVSMILNEPEKYQTDIMADSGIDPEFHERVLADCANSLVIMHDNYESCDSAEEMVEKIVASGADHDTAVFFMGCVMAALELSDKVRNHPDYGIEESGDE